VEAWRREERGREGRKEGRKQGRKGVGGEGEEARGREEV